MSRKIIITQKKVRALEIIFSRLGKQFFKARSSNFQATDKNKETVKTIKDSLYSFYCDDKDSLDINKGLEIVIKKYNNNVHSTTKFTPNQVFYSLDELIWKSY